jgi:hypothetical protein
MSTERERERERERECLIKSGLQILSEHGSKESHQSGKSLRLHYVFLIGKSLKENISIHIPRDNTVVSGNGYLKKGEK